VLEKLILVGAHAPSYAIGAKLLEVVGEISISGRQLNNLTAKIGTELASQRDAAVAAYMDGPLPQEHRTAETPIALAYVSIDGGRMQTRLDGGGVGVHEPHWRETKNALFLRMNGVSFEEDPHPELPKCFADQHRMKTLLPGIAVDDSSLGQPLQMISSTVSDWRPEKLFRTCLSSLTSSKKFGPMMAVEAELRGFYQAVKRAFVGDGLPYNWTIHAAYFPTFTAVLDFVHAVEHGYAAARCLAANDDDTWALHLSWTTSIWQGRVSEVIAALRGGQDRIGLPPTDCDESDPRKIVADTIRYFENNASRMQYPTYRREGLPVTSCHMESFVKELNHRVKGTEKFWNDGPNGEAILQVRAAAWCDDDRLARHLRSRPGNPLAPNARVMAATAG
jgi:hypothetical protein